MRTPTEYGSRKPCCNRLVLLCTLFLVGGCQTLDVFKGIVKTTPDASVSTEASASNTLAKTPAVTDQVSVVEIHSNKETSLNSGDTNDLQPLVAGNAWHEVRTLLRLRPTASKRIDKAIKFYAGKQRYFDRISVNAAPYLPYILQQIKRRGLPGELVLLPIIESAYYPYAVSPSNAAGLWQFMPSTGKHFGLRQTWWYDGRRDVITSTAAAIKYLEYLNRRVDGDWLLTLAAFNAGEGTVERAIKKNREAGKPTDYWSLDLPRETSLYVPRLLAVAAIVKDPARHNIELPAITNAVSFAQVDIDEQIDLALVADLANTDLATLYQLNPGFKKWASDPDGPHRVLVPRDSKAAFIVNLEERGPEALVTWRRHKIKRRETLGEIAANYHTSISALKKLNNLKGDVIRAGKILIVPASELPVGAYPLAESNTAQAKQVAQGEGKKSIYTIRAGDSLWTIARRHDVRVKDITRWNGIASKTTLQPGQKLTLWVPNTGTQKAKPSNTIQVSASSLSIMQPISYKVRNGDSLWTISRKFQVSVSDLRKWNQLSKNNLIKPGQTLHVYRRTPSGQVES